MDGLKDYRIVRKIAAGGFGEIFHAKRRTDGEEMALKVESNKVVKATLPHEFEVYRHLCGAYGIPAIECFWKESGYCALAMTLLGPSIEFLFNKCQRQFSLSTVVFLMEQAIDRLATIHQRGLVHGDVKPDNLLMGRGVHRNSVFMVDFGLAQFYMHGTTRGTFSGTVRYAPLSAHHGLRRRPRDDMESLGYVAVYLMKGTLPWQNISVNDEIQKREIVAEMKMSVSVRELCDGLPRGFVTYMEYCKMLKPLDTPNYEYLKRLFRTSREEHKHLFEWSALLQQTYRNQPVSDIYKELKRKLQNKSKFTENERKKRKRIRTTIQERMTEFSRSIASRNKRTEHAQEINSSCVTPSPSGCSWATHNREEPNSRNHSVSDALTLAEDVPTESRSEDEFDAYGKHVAYKLRTLKKSQRMLAQKLIDHVILESDRRMFAVNS